MSGSAYVEQRLVRGDDTPPLVWRFGTAGASEIPASAEFELTIWWPALLRADLSQVEAGQIVAASPAALAVDVAGGTVTWSYSTGQSLSLPAGGLGRYALRCLHGGHRQTWAQGRIWVEDAPAAVQPPQNGGSGGGAPSPGGSGATERAQVTPAGTWIIPHGLGRRPIVTVYDTSGAEMLADVVATATTVTIVFAVPTAGSVVLA
ncbi:hypothetical protein [Methylobacterium organophilum]|uniref:Uncharacterized protein n=1 Tax=Methylobacterium organophilum TaxID=410 RepID=A0ABQ4TAM8_METOR|nr:hypothetical protein [Methylobacterium organophilum]GJE27935.1 hypothetical protein LKMONMHP_2797 [Methylobacterium organophilum]